MDQAETQQDSIEEVACHRLLLVVQVVLPQITKKKLPNYNLEEINILFID